MQFWRYLLAGSVCTALAFIPQGYVSQKVAMPTMETNPQFASLKLQKVSPANVLPARSPMKIFSGAASKPLSGVKICIDPGHGGQALSKTHYTGGTVGVATGQTESDVNLRVSLILRQYLQLAGAEVIMTRISDDRCQGDTCKREELDFRSNIANRHKADLFISVHHNQANKRDVNYTAVFYPGSNSAAGALAANISNSVSRYMSIRNVGAKVGDYRVLNKVNMPGVIVEASFMSNPEEDMRLANLGYNKMEAKAIATGILNYFRVTKGRAVDFNSLFAPIDDQAHTAQAMADASISRREVVEQKSLFGRRYEELTYNQNGAVVKRREVGNSSLAARASSRKSSGSNESVKKLLASPSSKSSSKSVASAKSSGSSSKGRVTLERSKATGASKPVVSSTKKDVSEVIKNTKAPARKSSTVASKSNNKS